MGADITLFNEKNTGEPVADLLVKSSSLHGITIGGDIIPTLIDELPIHRYHRCQQNGSWLQL